MLDSILRIETPEGIELHLHPAGPAPRALAWVLDALIRGVFYALAAPLLFTLGELGAGLFLLLIFAAEWFYPVFFELRRHAATPGKRAMGLKVVRTDGAPLDLGSALIRNLLRTADALPLFYGIGLLTALSNPRFQRLGDLAAGTLVVHARGDAPRPAFKAAGGSLPPPVALTPDEVRALVEFAERRPLLSEARAAELAALVPVLMDASGRPQPDRIRDMANWLTGRQT
ncbi:MAG: RDD family protein [Gammaproteobacteria bacterium]